MSVWFRPPHYKVHLCTMDHGIQFGPLATLVLLRDNPSAMVLNVETYTVMHKGTSRTSNTPRRGPPTNQRLPLTRPQEVYLPRRTSPEDEVRINKITSSTKDQRSDRPSRDQSYAAERINKSAPNARKNQARLQDEDQRQTRGCSQHSPQAVKPHSIRDLTRNHPTHCS
jgi:hypothetical protein